MDLTQVINNGDIFQDVDDIVTQQRDQFWDTTANQFYVREQWGKVVKWALCIVHFINTHHVV